MICYGVVDTLASYGFGALSKRTGRVPCFLAAAALNYAAILVMLLWVPAHSSTYVLYALAVMWGLGDAVWQTQCNAFVGVVFEGEEEAAFSNFRLW
jgi:MFS family permease